MLLYNSRTRFEIIRHSHPYLKCKVFVKLGTPVLTTLMKIDIFDTKTRTFTKYQVKRVSFKSSTHLHCRRKHITGRCVLQVMK